MDPTVLRPIDEDLVQVGFDLMPWVKRYFRGQVRGLEHIPEGPALIVGNHNAGTTFLEPFVWGYEYLLQTGRRDLSGLAHDAVVSVPVVGNLLMMCGAIKASHEAADAAFSAGRKVVVFPGGNYEAFRPWTERNRVDFGGHKGFVRLALRHQVPIVPLLCVGGHDAFFVLTRGERLSRALRADKWLRSRAWPIYLGLPWGIAVGPFFHLPLPTRTLVVVGEPMPVDGTTPADADDEAVIDRWYEAVEGRLQAMMDEAVRERRRR